jgi:integrase/recombinase XerC/integrase/recombinase XerD
MGLKDSSQIFAGIDENLKEMIGRITDPELKGKIYNDVSKIYRDFMENCSEVKKSELPSPKILLEHYENLLASEGKAKNTIYCYILRAKSFLNYMCDGKLSFVNLDAGSVESYLAEVRKTNLKTNSFSKEVAVLKSFLNFLNSRNYSFLDNSKIKAPKKVETLSEVLNKEDVLKIEEYLSNRKEKFKLENSRDRLVLYLGIKCGLRKSEARNLDWEHINFEIGRIKVSNSKGGKDRAVYFKDDLKEILLGYRKSTGFYKGAVIRGKCRKRMSKASMQDLIRRIYIESGIYRQGLCFHSLRHTYAENLRRKGTDVYIISRLLGHSRIDTTETYLHSNEDDLRNAIAV